MTVLDKNAREEVGGLWLTLAVLGLLESQLLETRVSLFCYMQVLKEVINSLSSTQMSYTSLKTEYYNSMDPITKDTYKYIYIRSLVLA